MAPVGTVRGRFELDAPALRTLRELERQGIRTQAQMKALGEEMDRVADRKAERRIDHYRGEVSKIAPTTIKALSESDRAWATYTRRINRHVDSQIAHVEALRLRIEALGRTRGVATVGTNNVGGGFPMNPATGGGFAGGGGRGLIRSLDAGPLSLGPRAWPFLLGLGLPVGAAAVGGGGAILGSAGSAALGAGALAFPAGLGALAGAGTVAGAAVPAGKAIGEAAKAQKAFNDAVRDFGRTATQTKNARRELAQAYQAAPRGTRALLGEVAAFRTEFGRATRPAQEQWTQLLRTGVAGGRRIAPAFGSAALTSTTAVRGAGTDFTRFATGRWGRGALGLGSNIFAENLPNVERSMENVLRTTTNLARAARPFFREGVDWLESWTRGWDRSTRDTESTRDAIGTMVDHLRAWKNLGGATFRLAGSLGAAGSPSGRGAVEDLTTQINQWDRWVNRNPAQTRAFFRRATEGAKDLAGALWEIVRALGRMSDDLLPLLSHFSQLLSGAGALGLLQPGALALSYGALRGARGGGARGLGGGGAAGLGGAEALGAGYLAGRGLRGARGGLGGARAIPGMTPYGGPQLVGERFYGLSRARGPALRIPGALRGAGRAFAPIAGILGALSFAGFEGNVGQRTQAALSDATLGIVRRPLTGAEQQDEVMRRVDEILGGLPQGRSGRAQRTRIAQLRGLTQSGGDAFAGLSTSGFLGVGGGGPNAGQIRKGTRELRRALQDQVDAFRDYRRGVRDLRLERVSRDLGEAFGIRLRGAGGARAIQQLQRDIFPALRQVGKRGDKALAQNAVDWARTAARGNPRLMRQVRILETGIEQRFRGMGRKIAIINGNIYDGSRKAWDNIANALTSRAERARQEVTESFTAIQRQAIGSLRAMGFSAAQARSLVRAEEGGGGGRKYARETIRLGQSGSSPSRQQAQANQRNARGGRIWGAGLGDNVSVGPGQKGAPGELVLSRHTEEDVDRDLRRAGRPPVASRVGRGRPHGWAAPPGGRPPTGHTVPASMRMATGGRIVPIPWAPGERTNASILGLLTRIHRGFGVNVSDSFGPGHQSPGHTVYGTAVDFVPGSTGWQGVNRLVAWAARRGYKVLYDGRFGSTAWPNHGEGNHAHIEFGSGGARGGIPAGGLGGLGRVNLRARRSRLGGVPGALSTRAGQLYAGGLERRINRTLGSGAGLGGFSGGGSAAANRRLARRMMLAMGWPASEWGSLNPLWTKESGFDHTARNPTSGALGIPQALGHTLPPGYAENPATQIRWGLRYIRGRYGSPSRAWAFHQGHNWYARGGRIPSFQHGGGFDVGPGRRGGLFYAGDNPYDRERVTIKPIRRRRPSAPGGLGGRQIHVSIEFKGPVSVRSDADIEKIAERASEKAGKKLLAILDGDDD